MSFRFYFRVVANGLLCHLPILRRDGRDYLGGYSISHTSISLRLASKLNSAYLGVHEKASSSMLAQIIKTSVVYMLFVEIELPYLWCLLLPAKLRRFKAFSFTLGPYLPLSIRVPLFAIVIPLPDFFSFTVGRGFSCRSLSQPDCRRLARYEDSRGRPQIQSNRNQCSDLPCRFEYNALGSPCRRLALVVVR